MSEAQRYAKPPDLLADDEHPVAIMGREIRPGEEVLDIGCGSGEIGALLAATGVSVDGIEANVERARLAATRLRTVVNAHAGAPGSEPPVLAGPYDVVMLFDVIEHSAEPDTLFSWVLERLKATGRIYLLVPNSAHISARLKILRGDWSYEDFGLFDRDHLRFYDTATMGELGARFGLRETRRWNLGVVPRWWPPPHARWVSRWPNLLAYQVLLRLDRLGPR